MSFRKSGVTCDKPDVLHGNWVVLEDASAGHGGTKHPEPVTPG